jgi:hypothetical protein
MPQVPLQALALGHQTQKPLALMELLVRSANGLLT